MNINRTNLASQQQFRQSIHNKKQKPAITLTVAQATQLGDTLHNVLTQMSTAEDTVPKDGLKNKH